MEFSAERCRPAEHELQVVLSTWQVLQLASQGKQMSYMLMKPSPQRLQDWLVLERTSRLLQLVQSVNDVQVLQAGAHL